MMAEISKKDIAESGRFAGPVVTAILPAAEFFMAEEYHQDYSVKTLSAAGSTVTAQKGIDT